jgi:hypothetical protein
MFQKLKRLLLQWKLEKAAQWFGVFVTSEVKPAYYYRYAQSLDPLARTKQIKSWRI